MFWTIFLLGLFFFCWRKFMNILLLCFEFWWILPFSVFSPACKLSEFNFPLQTFSLALQVGWIFTEFDNICCKLVLMNRRHVSTLQPNFLVFFPFWRRRSWTFVSKFSRWRISHTHTFHVLSKFAKLSKKSRTFNSECWRISPLSIYHANLLQFWRSWEHLLALDIMFIDSL
jgi:hypothetical protein